MNGELILGIEPLGFSWKTYDPFLFCVHHDDAYPAGNAALGPAASLAGRDIGQDFAGLDGWRMYHGDTVPGFPAHPHRGFETVTIARRGFIDHSDSLGATARFGAGDVQWLTAGKGIQHSEMFPLLDPHGPNPLELFQIWLNLPSAGKMVEPHFSMLWSHDIPTQRQLDAEGRSTRITTIAGRLPGVKAPPPPPRSWAADPRSDVAIWLVSMEPSARYTLPPAAAGTNRTLNFYRGGTIRVAGEPISSSSGVRLRPDTELLLENGAEPAELLLLQGRPIGERVAQYGPFVMNSASELEDAFNDYRRTRFGGWPWPSDAPVHPRDAGRFAKHADGRIEHIDG